MQEFGAQILMLASDVSDRSPEQLLTADFKDFSVEGSHFGVGTIETTNRNHLAQEAHCALAGSYQP